MNDNQRNKVLHRVDQWLDAVAANPLRIDDGECHEIKITASYAAQDRDLQPLFDFTVEAGSTETL